MLYVNCEKVTYKLDEFQPRTTIYRPSRKFHSENNTNNASSDDSDPSSYGVFIVIEFSYGDNLEMITTFFTNTSGTVTSPGINFNGSGFNVPCPTMFLSAGYENTKYTYQETTILHLPSNVSVMMVSVDYFDDVQLALLSTTLKPWREKITRFRSQFSYLRSTSQARLFDKSIQIINCIPGMCCLYHRTPIIRKYNI